MEISKEEFLAGIQESKLSISVDFSQHGNSRTFIRDGWHGADERFTWVEGDRSTLEFVTPYIDRDFTLSIRLGSIGGEHPKELPLGILVNGIKLAELIVSTTRDVFFRIPMSCLNESADLQITLKHPVQVRPCDIDPKSTDTRRLSFAIYQMKLECETISTDEDVLARYLRENRLDLVASLKESIWWPSKMPSSVSMHIDFGVDGNHYQYVSKGWCYQRGGFSIGVGETVLIVVPLPFVSDHEALQIRLGLALDAEHSEQTDTLHAQIDCNGIRILNEAVDRVRDFRRLVEMNAKNGSLQLVLNVLNGSKELETVHSIAETYCIRRPCLRLRYLEIRYAPPLGLLPFHEEQTALRVVDNLLAECREKEAVALLSILWSAGANRISLIQRLVEVARIRCDVALEMTCLHWAEESGQDVVVELAGRLMNCGRPFAAAERLRKRLLQGGSTLQCSYELGLAYRNLGWLDLSVRSHKAVVDPHPHWGGPIRNIRDAFVTTRKEAIDLLKKYRADKGVHSEEADAKLAGCLIRIGRVVGARYIISRSPKSNAELWKRVETSIIFRESGAAAALHFFRRIGVERQAQMASQIVFADLLNQNGQFNDAANLYLRIGLETKNDSMLANAAIAYCLNGSYGNASHLWKNIGDTVGISNYVAQVVVSEFAARRITPRFRLITETAPTPPSKNSDGSWLNIIQFWDDKQVPEDVKACTESWSSLNYGADHRVYSEEAARELISFNYGSEAVQCFDACHHPAMKSDFFRVLALHLFGGLYVDADLICLVPIKESLLAAWVTEPNVLGFPLVPAFPFAANNDVILASKGSKILEQMAGRIISTVTHNVKNGIKSDIGQVTGPGLLTKTLARQLIDQDVNQENGGNETMLIAIPYAYRRRIIASNNHLEYFRKKTHWSLI